MMRLYPDGNTWVRNIGYTQGLLDAISTTCSDQDGTIYSREDVQYNYATLTYAEDMGDGNTNTWDAQWPYYASGPGFARNIGTPDYVTFTDNRVGRQLFSDSQVSALFYHEGL
jgi:hypothetical protein